MTGRVKMVLVLCVWLAPMVANADTDAPLVVAGAVAPKSLDLLPIMGPRQSLADMMPDYEEIDARLSLHGIYKTSHPSHPVVVSTVTGHCQADVCAGILAMCVKRDFETFATDVYGTGPCLWMKAGMVTAKRAAMAKRLREHVAAYADLLARDMLLARHQWRLEQTETPSPSTGAEHGGRMLNVVIKEAP